MCHCSTSACNDTCGCTVLGMLESREKAEQTDGGVGGGGGEEYYHPKQFVSQKV